jgi:hypothetical protein
VTVKYRPRIYQARDGMELKRSESENKSQLAYRYFVDTCRSEATRETYITALHSFMDYLKLPLDAYDRLSICTKDNEKSCPILQSFNLSKGGEIITSGIM